LFLFLVAPLLALAPSAMAAPARPAQPLGAEWTLAGQKATCGKGPQHRHFDLRAEERLYEVGMGFSVDAMTFAGKLAPVLEVCEGDTVTLTMQNAGTMAHGLDTHAFRIPTEKFGPVDTGKSLTLTSVVRTPGAFMFHCASGQVTDVHIKSGMYGEMIVYPRKLLPVAKEIAVLQGGFFGKPDANRLIHAETVRMTANDPLTLEFNGRLEHQPVKVKVGERVRVWFVNAGPGASAVHVMGTLLDRFYASGNPRNVEYDIQTGLVPAGGGAAFELTLPEKGSYMLVDHDNLRFLPYGMMIDLVAE